MKKRNPMAKIEASMTVVGFVRRTALGNAIAVKLRE